MSEEPELLWQPTPARAARSTLTRYMRWLQNERGLQFAITPSCGSGRWTNSRNSGGRWSSSLRCASAKAVATGPGRALDARRAMVPGRALQLRRACVPRQARRGRRDPPRLGATVPGLVDLGTPACRDRGVRRWAARLRRGRGRPRGRLHAQHPETVAAFLACASIGAIWSSAAPEFGARSVIDRFAQVTPKVMLAIDGYRYGGKDFDRSQNVERIAAQIPGLERVVRFGYLDGTGWEDGFLGNSSSELSFAPLPFDHPLWILYSSGTTGLPKPIVHSQGGILIEVVKNSHLHLDSPTGRPVVLVLDDRLDDVELPGRGPADRGLDCAVRWQPRPSLAGTCCGTWRRTPASPRSGRARRTSRGA